MDVTRVTASSTPAPSWQDRLLALAGRQAAKVRPLPDRVTLTGSPVAATYTAKAAAVDTSSNAALGALIARNAVSTNAPGAFAGLGQAVLGRFATDGADFSRTMALPESPARASVSLALHAEGGATVTVDLRMGDNGLSVHLATDRPLGVPEKRAVADLGGAFQRAIDAAVRQPPSLDLSDLLDAGQGVLTSVDLSVSAGPPGASAQTITFHADAAGRALKVDGPSGKVDVALDMRQAAQWGNRAQREAALVNYLDQFDAAAQRGHGDKGLTTLFRQAFIELNSRYPSTPADALDPNANTALSDTDHAMLSGLADFRASVSQAAVASNPLRSAERDTFAYDVAQTTTFAGGSARDRRTTQTQSSHLTASFHEPLLPGGTLHLTDKPASQNYGYTQINDSARAVLSLAYVRGKREDAQVAGTAAQNTHVQKYAFGQLIEEIDSPSHRRFTKDLVAVLDEMDQGRRSGTTSGTLSLDRLHSDMLFQSDPARLPTDASETAEAMPIL